MKGTNSDIPKRASFKTVFSNGIWVYKTLYKMSPRTVILLSIATLFMGIFPTIGQLYIAKIIDSLISVSNSGMNSFGDIFTRPEIVTPITIYAIYRAISNFSGNLIWYLTNQINKYYMVIFEVEFERRISDLDIQHFEDPKIMDSIRKASDNTYKMYEFFNVGLNLFEKIVSVAISAYVVFSLSPFLGLFITVFSTPAILIRIEYINTLWAFLNSTYEKRRKSWWLSNRLRRPENREEATITNSNYYVYEKVKELWNFLGPKELKIRKKTFLKSTIDNFIMFLKNFITIAYLLFRTADKSISIGLFTFYYQKVFDFDRDLTNITTDISNLWDYSRYIRFIRDVFEIKPAIVSGTKSIKTDTPPKIEFKNVWFKYPSGNKYAIKDLNLIIDSQEEIAFVGENGAGKTTLIKLLLRFYDPTKGEILVNDIPLKEIDLNFYYRAIGSLFQEFEKFEELDIEQNIKIGNINSTEGIKTVKEAAKLADADSFIEKLGEKYKQVLHSSFTGGTKLSTGQWQKVALARMFYRNAPVLILDEPTASIDATAEYKIFKRIFETFKGKTLIIISHRFSTVRNAQKIYVIHHGEIVEQGSHEQLIKKGGRYKKAFNLQAKGYKA
ncbi:MAG: ABC transporter ATP-binding protein [bacterium]